MELGADEQLALTASQAVGAIASGSLSAEAYVTTLLARAENLTSLNSIITLNKEGALAAAKNVDACRRAGHQLGVLAGLPLIVKDNINTKDLPTTGGTPALQHFRPASNAEVLQKLLDAGAIILGKANMHELALGITNTNFSTFAGAVKNPYDASRVPGGSSGGTGAAIAARIAPGGLGSDTGGSVRIPASFNGIAGLRPSVGNGGLQRRYSTTGAIPLSHTLDTVGPMGRTVADLALLDAVITDTPVPSPIPLAGLRFGVPPVLWNDIDHDVAAVMKKAKEKLTAAGVVLVESDMPELLDLGSKTIFPIALHEPTTALPAYLREHGAKGITLENIASQVASPDVRNGFQAILQDAFSSAYGDAINLHRPRLQKIFASYFEDNKLDAIFFPTVPVPPVPIDFKDGSSTISVNGGPPVDGFYTIIRNMSPDSVAGLPSLSLPAGQTPAGLPVGMEIDGPVGSDKRLLGIGMAMEAWFGTLPAPAL
jgi:mandelamide amidase